MIFEAVAIGLGETAAAHEMTAGRWLLLVVVLAAMAATYAAFALHVNWAQASRVQIGIGRA